MALVPSGGGGTVASGALGPRRGRAEKVLEEDEYTEAVERIIERDFFPDVPALQNKLEWLQAVNSGDPLALRNAQLNIAARRAGVPTPLGATPAEFATPAAATPYGAATPSALGRLPTGGPVPPGAATPAPAGGAQGAPATTDPSASAPAMSLNSFLAKHTSEDNASFAEIMEEGNKRRRMKNTWLYETPGGRDVALLEGAPRAEGQQAATDGYGTGGAPDGGLIGWKHVPKNGLYYPADAQPLSAREVAEQRGGAAKAILHRNTRLPSASKSSTGLFSPDSKPSTPAAGTPAGEGGTYSRLATPSMTPGADGMSPLMTWGDIESTPLRIEAEDMPQGPTFRLPEEKPRDLLGRRLAGATPQHMRSRPGTTRFGSPLSVLRRNSGTPGHKRGGTPLSASAKKRLLSQMQGAKGGGDLGLRASYQRTPAGAPGGSPALHAPRPPRHTPAIGNKRAGSSRGGGTPAAAAAAGAATASAPDAKQPAPANLTDGLLNI